MSGDRVRMGLFSKFTADQLELLKRQAIESSFEIMMGGKYSQDEKELHKELLNEIIKEIKNR